MYTKKQLGTAKNNLVYIKITMHTKKQLRSAKNNYVHLKTRWRT